MNKKQAKQAALKIAVDLLTQEIDSPSEIACPYYEDQDDAAKIYDALEIMMLKLDSKVVRDDAV